jgi:hypothetical protein
MNKGMSTPYNCASQHNLFIRNILKLELWVTSLSDTPRLQYYDVQTLEYRYISKLPMKNERIWSYVKETTSHLQNKLTKNIHSSLYTLRLCLRMYLAISGC